MNAATPLLVADILNTASPSAPSSGGSGGDDLLAAASFAALLHIANFVADAPTDMAVPEERGEEAGSEPNQAGAADTAPTTDSLLLLSNVVAATLPATASEVASTNAATPIPSAKLVRMESVSAALASSAIPAGDDTAPSTTASAAQPLPASAEPSEARTDAAATARALLASSRGDAKDPAATSASNIVPIVARDEPDHRAERATHEAVAPAKAVAPEPGLTLVAPSTTTSLQSATAVTLVDIATPAFQPGWHEEATHRIAALTVRGTERAELRLHPAELGPVELRIDVRDGEASVAIVAANPATRDALEQALPALRDLLAQQNIALGEASVHDGRAEHGASREEGSRSHRSVAGEPAHTVDAPAAMFVRAHRLVDVFA